MLILHLENVLFLYIFRNIYEIEIRGIYVIFFKYHFAQLILISCDYVIQQNGFEILSQLDKTYALNSTNIRRKKGKAYALRQISNTDSLFCTFFFIQIESVAKIHDSEYLLIKEKVLGCFPQSMHFLLLFTGTII